MIETLQPPEDAVFYLIDSMRPLEVKNVYNGIQIKIIVLQNELGIEQKLVPEFEDIFDEEEENEEVDSANEESDGDGDEEEDEEQLAERLSNKHKSKRKRFDPEFLEKRHKRREWEQKR